MRTAVVVCLALAGCGNPRTSQENDWPPGEAVTSPDGVHLHRFSVPGGWLYWVDGSYDGGFVFVPFPKEPAK